MTLKEICEVIETPERHLSDIGKATLQRIDVLAADIEKALGAEKTMEIVDIIGPGWEYEFFLLLTEYSKKDH